MGHRNQRHGDADQSSDLGSEHAAGIDDQIGFDGSLVGDHALDVALRRLDRGDPRVLADLRAAPSCAFDEGERELAGVDVAVGREVGGAEDAVRGHGREHALRLFGRDELEGKAEGLRPAGLA